MLERLDTERIRRAASRRGFPFCEIYGESRRQLVVQVEDKLLAHRHQLAHGLALRLSDGHRTLHLSTPALDTEAALALIDGRQAPLAAAADPQAVPSWEWDGPRFTQLLRTTWPEAEGISLKGLCLEAVSRRFGILREDGTAGGGTETWAGVEAQWAAPALSGDSLWAADLPTLLDRWECRNPFRRILEGERRGAHPWPAPRGRVPVHWSPRAVAKLLSRFLRAFEGDLYLENLSFLADVPLPLPLPFSLEDAPSRHASDHEGHPVGPMSLFGEGQPLRLACTRGVAARLGVAPSGHSRRESYRVPPVVGLWSPVLRPHRTVPEGIHALPWGVAVEDLDVARFDPTTSRVTLRLTDARLIHQGEPGEAVAPVTVETDLLSLLRSWQAFGPEAETLGLRVQKRGQRWVTEVTAPAALTEGFDLPGQVPLSYYW